MPNDRTYTCVARMLGRPAPLLALAAAAIAVSPACHGPPTIVDPAAGGATGDADAGSAPPGGSATSGAAGGTAGGGGSAGSGGALPTAGAGGAGGAESTDDAGSEAGAAGGGGVGGETDGGGVGAAGAPDDAGAAEAGTCVPCALGASCTGDDDCQSGACRVGICVECPDADSDGVCDDIDACTGDDSSGDTDADGVCDDTDNCVPLYNPDQADLVPPVGVGDACNVVFVDVDATGAGDGSSWTDALTDLDAAVTAAQADVPTGPLKDIWVAGGTYRASAPNAQVLTMVDGLAIYGGFVGTETRFSERPDVLDETVIDGDYLGNDVPLDAATVEAERLAPDQPTRSDNATRVMTMAPDTTLDGVTVRGGYLASVGTAVGINVPANATGVSLTRVTVRDNIAAVFQTVGAGVYASSGSEVAIADSLFLDNITWNGGGLSVIQSTVTVRGSIFRGNGCIGGQGAGIVQNSGDLRVDDSQFVDNILIGNGGCGITAIGGTSTMTNVLFANNIGRIGAMSVSGGPRTFVNVTVTGHSAMAGEGAVHVDSESSFVNAVFWDNTPGDFSTTASKWPGSVIHSCSPTDLSSFVGGDNVRLDASTPALGTPFSVGPSGELFLSQTASGDAYTSACVDGGDMTTGDPDTYFPGWSSLTTRSDGVVDGIVSDAIDMGFHYRP